jgi:hypothetical protein
MRKAQSNIQVEYLLIEDHRLFSTYAQKLAAGDGIWFTNSYNIAYHLIYLLLSCSISIK